jgi:hypothetical protein
LENEIKVAVAAAISSAAAFCNVTVLLIAHRVSSLRRAHRVADFRALCGLLLPKAVIPSSSSARPKRSQEYLLSTRIFS